jgi:hypothetical protein
MSQATQAQVEVLFDRLSYESRTGLPPTVTIPACAPFDWQGQVETSRTPAARDHIEIILGTALTDQYELQNVQNDKSLFNIESERIGNLSGGTDLVIVPARTGDFGLRTKIFVNFELKTSHNAGGLDSSCRAQAKAEFLAVTVVSHQPYVLTILSDLVNPSYAWRAYYDHSKSRTVVENYKNLSLDEMYSLVLSHLQQNQEYQPPVSTSSSNGISKPERALVIDKLRQAEYAAIDEYLDRFEDQAEGTEDWSKERGEAAWDLLRNLGVEKMPMSIHYSMYI